MPFLPCPRKTLYTVDSAGQISARVEHSLSYYWSLETPPQPWGSSSNISYPRLLSYFCRAVTWSSFCLLRILFIFLLEYLAEPPEHLNVCQALWQHFMLIISSKAVIRKKNNNTLKQTLLFSPFCQSFNSRVIQLAQVTDQGFKSRQFDSSFLIFHVSQPRCGEVIGPRLHSS